MLFSCTVDPKASVSVCSSLMRGSVAIWWCFSPPLVPLLMVPIVVVDGPRWKMLLVVVDNIWEQMSVLFAAGRLLAVSL